MRFQMRLCLPHPVYIVAKRYTQPIRQYRALFFRSPIRPQRTEADLRRDA